MDFASKGSYGAVYESDDKTYCIGAMVRARDKPVAEAVSEHNNSYKNLWFLIFLIVFGIAFSVLASYTKAKERL
ncbi:MAG: hypothetical protein ACTTJF_07730 [Campylobacter sp.]|uniref:hypothetical protein n=1 Tax=Campylobacter sp. TaxID=205 RepID=UPI003FA13554